MRKLIAAMALITPLLCGSASAFAANIVETAAGAGQFNTLLAAAKAAGLADALATKKSITVFAPTDKAFAKLPKGTVETLLKPENKAKLQAILLYHVVPKEVTAAEVPTKATAVPTLDAPETLNVRRHGKTVRVNNARVIKADVKADNGIIHVVDRVLLPK
jgi:uncharacterized surface protein with fasciclin (FAS1) repeats